MRRLVAIIAVLAVTLGACSDSEPAGSSGEGSERTTATSVTTAPSESGTFEIPDELLERVDEAGFEFPTIDYPPQPEGVEWPTGEWPTGEIPAGVDATAVETTITDAFNAGSGEGDVIDAVLVVKDGRLVVEDYNGWDPEEFHPSWSMAKSVTSSLVGILAGRGEIDVFEPASAPEWADPADPRHAITLDDLLRMSSGLEWTEDYSDPDGDVLTILGGEGAADRAGYAASKPLKDEPDTLWYYSTGTANIVAREVAEKVGFGEEFSAWITENLFKPLGIAGADMQIDDAGVINGGSWVAMRPVDFARFGYLYLRGGEWDGEQLLPREWVDYSRLPTPTAEKPEYGAHWWIDEADPARFYASGFNGQSITVVPEEDLVIVVLSNTGTDRDTALVDRLEDLFGEAGTSGTGDTGDDVAGADEG